MKKLILILGIVLIGVTGYSQGVYSNASGDFSVEAIDGTKNVYVTGASFTIGIHSVVDGYGWRTSSGNINQKLNFSSVQVSNDTIFLAGEGTNFASGDTVTLFLVDVGLGYDTSTGTVKTTEQAADYAHYTAIEQVIDETGLAGSKAYGVFNMASYDYFSVHANVADSGWVKAYVTNNSAASNTNETSDWVDYSTTLFGADSIGNGTEGMYFQDTPIMPLKVMLRAYSPDDTCAIDVWIRRHY